ncbi:KAP family P-loop NTPase fold protein [Vibrio diabolicus]|uniref:KAP family P-loop NTPase fold protein n=1 Tax=Vibrio diabolicus TaxID=50719 RepID=UPI002495925E|nr:P-loop NTPase fold protein [Vibrio diabolicus]
MSVVLTQFDWTESLIDDSGLELMPDSLERAKYAQFMHNYLVSASKDGGYVLNLNARWGTGKTYFLKRWQHSIKDRHPVVYIDAWKQDYSDDPMLAVISSIISEFSQILPEGNQIVEKLGAKALRFVKAVGPVVLKQVIKKYTGVDFEEANESSEDETAGGASESSAIFDGSIGEAVANELINDHNEKLASITYLKQEIKSLVDAVIAHNRALKSEFQGPAFVFIDELDRCRPSYAVEMLEVIKHFFELDNVVFVVATDTEQLQHAVKAVYGQLFDAQLYLGRFFRRRFSLLELSRKQFIDSTLNDIFDILPQWQECSPSIIDTNHISIMITNVADNFELSLRDTLQLVDRFLAIMNNLSEGKTLNPYLLLYLMVLKELHYEDYINWLRSSQSLDSLPDLNSTSWKHINIGRGIHLHIAKDSVGKYVPYDSWEHDRAPVISYQPSVIMSFWGHAAMKRSSENYEKLGRSIDQQIQRESDPRTQDKLRFMNVLANLNDSKEDYKNWVELAASID